jgi:ribonuclease HI
MTKKAKPTAQQTSLFETETFSKTKHWHLYSDGAARNNPGPAGAGIALFCDGKEVLKHGHYLGKRTNNQAEYLALLIGLYYVSQKANKGDELSVFADSELLVRQMMGTYKVKNAELKELQQIAFKLLMPYKYGIYHIYREENLLADEMANVGIDQKNVMPAQFKKILSEHGVNV